MYVILASSTMRFQGIWNWNDSATGVPRRPRSRETFRVEQKHIQDYRKKTEDLKWKKGVESMEGVVRE
jgi:hypothetical protein